MWVNSHQLQPRESRQRAIARTIRDIWPFQARRAAKLVDREDEMSSRVLFPIESFADLPRWSRFTILKANRNAKERSLVSDTDVSLANKKRTRVRSFVLNQRADRDIRKNNPVDITVKHYATEKFNDKTHDVCNPCVAQVFLADVDP